MLAYPEEIAVIPFSLLASYLRTPCVGLDLRRLFHGLRVCVESVKKEERGWRDFLLFESSSTLRMLNLLLQTVAVRRMIEMTRVDVDLMIVRDKLASTQSLPVPIAEAILSQGSRSNTRCLPEVSRVIET